MQDLASLIQRCINETAQDRGILVPPDLGPRTRLFGRDGVFDSLGLVGLIVAVEEAIEEDYEVHVSLANERAMSEKKSPFVDVGSLAAYIEGLLREEA